MVNSTMKINVIYEDNHVLVVEKPVNVPVQEDESKDEDLLTILKQYLKDKYQKPGNVYLGLVHRLDRPVGGVMVFAKTSKAASRLSKQVQDRTLDKIYRAVVLHTPKQPQDTFVDYLYKNKKTNRVQVVNKSHPEGKFAKLSFEQLATKNDLTLVQIQLETGRSHQIRVQFSSRNLPLWGDQRYNANAKVGQQIALWAYQLSFEHPTTKKQLTFVCNPPNQFPWNQYEI